MNILFIESTHQVLVEMLERSGFTCDYRPEISKAEIKEIISNYEGVITRSKIPFDKNLIDTASKLKFIGRVGAGMENIDVDYAASKSIICFNAPEGNRDAVGEHAVAMILNLFNKLCIANSEVKKGVWHREENRGLELGGKTVGIIGYGNTGSSFAKKISGFGVNILAFDKYKANYSDAVVTESSLKHIFEQADILSLHVPLTDETKYMVNDEFLNNFRKNIYLINTSRGKVVNTNDLSAAMKRGKVLGAALDVLEYEKSSFEKLHLDEMPISLKTLIDSNNVLLSPHVAGWTVESKYKLATVLAGKIIEHFRN